MKSLGEIQSDADFRITNQKENGLYPVLKELQDTLVVLTEAVEALTLRVEALENAS